MTALNRYVDRLRATFGPIPHFDPFDGGTNARILVLLETPGPSNASVRFTSRDNPTGTAKTLRALSSLARINRNDTVIWNAVPWVLDRRGKRLRVPSPSDLKTAATLLPELLALLPNLGSVILAGKTAGRLETEIARIAGSLKILRMPHPSPTYVNTSPSAFASMIATFKRAAASALR